MKMQTSESSDAPCKEPVALSSEDISKLWPPVCLHEDGVCMKLGGIQEQVLLETRKLGLNNIHETVSCWIPTVAVSVRSRFRSCGNYGGQNATGARFLGVLRFLLPFSFHCLLQVVIIIIIIIIIHHPGTV
jgi:hypothetical protein